MTATAEDVSIALRILSVVERLQECSFEELALACPELTWNQIFLAVDSLRQEGRVRLERKELGLYRIRASAHVTQNEPASTA